MLCDHSNESLTELYFPVVLYSPVKVGSNFKVLSLWMKS